MAKSHRLPTSLSQSVTSSLFAVVHSDIWGPFSSVPAQGYRYYVSFIDDFSKYTWIYPLVHKSEVFSKFIEFQKFVERQFNKTIQIIRTDNGGEYVNKQFQTHCKTTGISHQVTCPHTPSQNGVAERKHRHLIETTRALLIQASLPLYLWVNTLLTANYLINRMPSPNTSHKSPYELLHNKQPDYNHLKVLGCLCYPWLKPYTSHKLSPLSHPCIFIGYPLNQKGYKCLDLRSNKIYISSNVIFNETIFPYSDQSAQDAQHKTQHPSIPPLLLVPNISLPQTLAPESLHILPHHINPPQSTSISTSTVQSPTSHQHTNISSTSLHNTPHIQPVPELPHPPSQPTHTMLTRLKTGISKPKKIFDLTHIIQPAEPTTYNQAVKHEHWRRAMSQEFQALQAQGTWELVPPNSAMNILGSKWTFRTKYNSDGSIARHKARLVAKGFHQEYGIDYTETFSPVAKMPTIRVLILIALHHNWTIHQLDVSNAFLHGKLSDTVYMSQPPGFQDSTHPTHICKLKKALYGLKQSPRVWYATLSNHLIDYGFKISASDPSLFTYKSGSIRLYMLIYVDDILLTGNSTPELHKLLTNLHASFQMKNLGNLSQFLGIHTIKTKSGILLHQQSYAKAIIQRAGMEQAKPVASPISCKTTITSKSTEIYANPQLYRQIVGALQYLTITRPDIQFAVQQLSQHMQLPLNSHQDSLKRLLRYLQGTSNIGIPLNRSNLTLRGYVDADWASNQQDRKSISGYCNFLGTSLISWQVKKQNTIARSSTEAEYRALAMETTEILWLRQLLEDFHTPQPESTTVFCDNTSAIALANNPIFHARTKHIEVDCHFIRDCIKKNKISVHHISTEDQLADLFTKALPTHRFKLLSTKLTAAIHP
ncbi:Retrovirus-related Pol polyprotein from transposon TNT 1-94 [Dendrobium catenatum]|uniref:Retrovirus-related Pol polyprotein from transposon TNT 1-94 n=1 Tax=Dendrobium catenatum TaxID=906689 RepID=A0A2I0VX68_9ASPA|nr:Retrovirus-related Pol polyprotein from transposon TNT 1-94 [Dendrobium catenatum]